MQIILRLFFFLVLFFAGVNQSTAQRKSKINKIANQFLLSDSAIRESFIGISIYDPANAKNLFSYNADKFFTPASNTKLFSLYAGLKYLGDSLPALRYFKNEDTVFVLPTGDPTFLYSEFKYQPVADFFASSALPVSINDANWRTGKYGAGWGWDEYAESYMPERSPFPVAGNNVLFSLNTTGHENIIFPLFSSGSFIKSDTALLNGFVQRKEISNDFIYHHPGNDSLVEQYIPFITNGTGTAIEILNKTFPRRQFIKKNNTENRNWKLIRSQPVDSIFVPMMHRSDNFLAEQTLLMVSNEVLGYMNETDLIALLLKQNLRDIPSKPNWVDGCGLSRYNLFSPNDFIYILEKLKNEFGLERMKRILATGGKGTLLNYYLDDAGYIFAKTGTLSNNCALSGYLFTKKNKLLVFSVLANHYQTGAGHIRKAVQSFLEKIREEY